MATDYENFDRQYRLAAGPAGESDAGFEIGEVTEEYPVPLHIQFSFEKSDLETQNTGKVTVWNLSDEHLAVLETEDCCVSLRAGYGDRLSLIFTGIVSECTTTLDNADHKTEIELVDNLIETRDTYISLSYEGTVNWKTIMDDAAAQMGVAVSYSYNATFTDVSNGFSYVGPADDLFDKGCTCCGLSWSIQHGVLQVKKSGDVMSTEVYSLNKESGLLQIPARVMVAADDDSDDEEVGWDVVYFLNGAITVDDYVYLESEKITGYFRVYSVQIEGDNVTGDWVCSARLLELSES